MGFRIAYTSSDSLAKLASEVQKATNSIAFDLQLNPTDLSRVGGASPRHHVQNGVRRNP